jgi:murein DD-endopeptidase MepM/ murein hydrolase activator NlpD
VVKIIFLLVYLFVFGWSQEIPYYTLAQPLEQNARKIIHLNEKLLGGGEPTLIQCFCDDVSKTLQKGKSLTEQKDPEALNSYLGELRSLASRQDHIYQLYRQSLSGAIENNDKVKFEQLALIELEPLHHPRVRFDAIEYYQKNFSNHPIVPLDNLRKEQDLETKSIQYSIEQEKAYEEHLRTLKPHEAKRMKRGMKIGSRNSVMVVENKLPNGDIVFEAENLNPYLVTLSLDFEKLINLQTDTKLPLYTELIGYGKKEILRLKPIVATLQTDHFLSYGWVKGTAFANHDDSYLYRLPFAMGTSIRVSQGYNGGLSHRGLSAYAIDFSVPVGTPVYAAREGDVVGVDVSSNLGGPSPAYRPYMNYVNIRHSDGTLGNYYHLKQGGCTVKIGDTVKKGQLIAYSGNTGYTTAPHLHFSVSKVDPVSMRRPMNLPIKIQTLQGIVTNPHEGDHYSVQ